MKGISLFASAGIAEFGLKNLNIDIVLANELLETRAKAHKFWHPSTYVVQGDITKEEIKQKIIGKLKGVNIDFVLSTPPCQGVSLIGKNKTNSQMLEDKRNYLIFDSLEIIDYVKPKYILIENVPRFFKLFYPYKGELLGIVDILKDLYGKEYNIDFGVYNSADYGVPQNRSRAIIKMFKKGLKWIEPIKEKKVTVREAIGQLPSIEAGQVSDLKNHFGRKHTLDHIEFMKHTPTGKSAFENVFHFPRNKKTGKKLKGYSATYKRIDWDLPAPTITMRNDAISSQSNVHPGRLLPDGTYSDARVLSIRELFILSSIDPDLDVPDNISEIQVRHMIGEAVPPKLIEVITKGIF